MRNTGSLLTVMPSKFKNRTITHSRFIITRTIPGKSCMMEELLYYLWIISGWVAALVVGLITARYQIVKTRSLTKAESEGKAEEIKDEVEHKTEARFRLDQVEKQVIQISASSASMEKNLMHKMERIQSQASKEHNELRSDMNEEHKKIRREIKATEDKLIEKISSSTRYIFKSMTEMYKNEKCKNEDSK